MNQTLLPSKNPVRQVAENVSSRAGLSTLLGDFYKSTQSSGSWFYASWIETLLQYRSTKLGPLWISVGTALFVFVVGSLYGRVVLSGGSNIYLAHLAVGLVLWYLMQRIVVVGCNIFIINRSAILDGVSSYTDVILGLVTKNLIILIHNFVVIVLVFIYIGLAPTTTALALFFTLPLVVANLLWVCVIVAVLGARYPDFQEMVGAVLRLFFFLTPILWIPHQHVRGPFVDAALYLNPFYYMLEAVREPLVYGQIPVFEIGVLIVALPIGWLLASLLYMRARNSLALWL